MARPLAGFFVALEGIEGSGKSTVARRLAEAFRGRGRAVVATREPGGTAIGEQIRDMLLENAVSGMAAGAEALLFAASRAQLVSDVIRPALARGDVVIVDRFSDSSLAYQWGGRELPLETVKAVQMLATNGLQPDLKVLLDLPVPLGLQRRFAVDDQINRIDRETTRFHERVRAAYHSLVAADPERWRVVDASRPEPAVWSEVWNTVLEFDASASSRSAASGDSRRGLHP